RPAAQPVNEPLKHVIAEYKHQAQTITCVCGWHGKSSSPDGRTSEWTAHLAANRTKPRAARADLAPAPPAHTPRPAGSAPVARFPGAAAPLSPRPTPGPGGGRGRGP